MSIEDWKYQLMELESKSYREQIFDLIDENMSEIERMRILQINGIKAIPLGRRKIMRETINIDCKHIWNAIQRLREADVNNINIVENEIARVMSKYGVEQQHGHWKVVEDCGAYFNECSNCKGRLWEVEPEWIFCPYCACKMDEVTE